MDSESHRSSASPEKNRIERLVSLLARWSEKVTDGWNPVLVREIRQMMKGKFFPATFLIILTLTWFLTIISVLSYANLVSYAELGTSLFITHSQILTFCLCFVLPFSLFQSMRSEFYEKTFETLIITPLSIPRIIWGKLATTLVQLLVLTSTIAPFLCFTYLLEGVDILGILTAITTIFLVTIILALWGMMLGSLSAHSGWATVNTLLLLFSSFFVLGILETNLMFWYGRSSGFSPSNWITSLLCWFGFLVFSGWVCILIVMAKFDTSAPTGTTRNRIDAHVSMHSDSLFESKDEENQSGTNQNLE